MAKRDPNVVDGGTLSFSIESRVLRELGERLVKNPEAALLELVKNAYDADATSCTVRCSESEISVTDDGHGMTLNEFKQGWMRIGTGAKSSDSGSRSFRRPITGEKGIGRFAVRFLGKSLRVESVAYDSSLKFVTRLIAEFDWPAFDQNEDLGKVSVPYTLLRASDGQQSGTTLVIRDLSKQAMEPNLYGLRTAAIGVATPHHALLKKSLSRPDAADRQKIKADPGFALHVMPASDDEHEGDVAATVLDNYVLRAVVDVQGDRLKLHVYRHGVDEPVVAINDKYDNQIGRLYVDLRFFPHRKGTFAGLPLDGRKAKNWQLTHSGVAVFDRKFRVHPYGDESDDWLQLASDYSRRERDPKSSIAQKHLRMDSETYKSTQLNYMLKLPHPRQLLGVVQVEARRSEERGAGDGLVAAADREGFVHNAAYESLVDIVRGAAEAVAFADRELQQEEAKRKQKDLLAAIKSQTQEAIKEVQANPNISRPEKAKLVKHIATAQVLAEQHQERSKEREATLEVMGLLGVVAGFMTHEFGIALDQLQQAHDVLAKVGRRVDEARDAAAAIAGHLASLREFVTYSQGYIQGASSRPARPYPARPRIQQVVRVFGKYAEERSIGVAIDIERDLEAPMVPVSLYNGVALNLFTNALKALTAKAGRSERQIAFRAWNEPEWHYLEVSDTGIGIPAALRGRIFDPLFTTTASNRDPLGSGLGLGLTLVKKGVESYGGKVEVVDPPPSYETCFRVRLPLRGVVPE